MSEHYYHYTSRQGAQGIVASGRILPSPGGYVFLSPELYDAGARAADALSIQGKPVEFVIVLPVDQTQILSDRILVSEIRDGYGRVIRRGQGWQVTAPGDLPVPDGAQVLPLQAP